MSALLTRRVVKDRRPSRPPKSFVRRSTRLSSKRTSTPKLKGPTIPQQPDAGHLASPPPEHGSHPHSISAKRPSTLSLHSAPSPKSESGSHLAFDEINRPGRYIQYAYKFRPYWVGPMDIREFLNLLPTTDIPMPNVVQQRFRGIVTMKQRKYLHDLLVCDVIDPGTNSVTYNRGSESCFNPSSPESFHWS